MIACPPIPEYGDSVASTNMTIREYFAVHVDFSDISLISTFKTSFGRPTVMAELAEYSAALRVLFADALIAELNKK